MNVKVRWVNMDQWELDYINRGTKEVTRRKWKTDDDERREWDIIQQENLIARVAALEAYISKVGEDLG